MTLKENYKNHKSNIKNYSNLPPKLIFKNSKEFLQIKKPAISLLF